ncbi:MAG: sugar transferase [Bacteroidota bacterium]
MSRLVHDRHSPIVLLPEAYELILASAGFMEDGDRLMLSIYPRACRWPWPMIKRMADVVLSLIGLVVLSPFLAVIALAIRLDSPGPVIFRQARVGKGGRVFDVLKFRTMVPDAEAHTGAVIAAGNDPRITRVGRWLRMLRLDEFPQLINVLQGTMSLVGPRPERPEFEAEFRTTIEGYDLRHLVKPGITGLAQIRGRYDTPAEDKLRYELAYIFLWSPLLDLKIILQTIAVMLTPEQASSSLGKAARLPAHDLTGDRVRHASRAEVAAANQSFESK